MIDFLADNFNTCVFLAILLVAMIPTLESKIAIPLALSVKIWGDKTLSPTLAIVATMIGGIIACLLMLLIFKKVSKKMSGFVYEKFYDKFKNKIKNVNSKGKSFFGLLSLTTFVAVPLPLTGVYAGSVIAGFSKLSFWSSFLAIVIGDLISCLIMLLLCQLFNNSAFYILIASLVIVAVYLVILFVSFLFKKLFGGIKKRKAKFDY